MENKKFLIIGGTHGIGKQIVENLEASGNTVITLARSASAQHQCDVLDFTEPLPEIHDSIEGLVYCPGTVNIKPLAQISFDEFKTDWEINALGAFRVIKEYFQNLKKAEKAAILLFSTVAVKQGMPYHSSISSAKGAVEGLTLSLAAELAPKIRVNAIAPSITDTPLVEKILTSETKRESLAKRHPLQKIGTPEDIAKAAEFLLSDDSSWITGQIIGVDGGLGSLRI